MLLLRSTAAAAAAAAAATAALLLTLHFNDIFNYTVTDCSCYPSHMDDNTRIQQAMCNFTEKALKNK